MLTHLSPSEKTMPIPTPEEVLVAAKKLIDATPDFQYRSPDGSCHYNSGGDVRYPNQCGCLFGQALTNCGFTVPDKLEGRGITTVLDSSAGVGDFLATLQAAQDACTPWQEAWLYAIAQWKSNEKVTAQIESLIPTE